MIRRALLLVICVTTLACSPPPRQPEPPRVWNVSPRDLHAAYVVNDDGRWSGQTVRVVIRPGAYTVTARTLHWCSDRPIDAPDIVFECSRPPTDNSKSVSIVGKVRGRVYDEEGRLNGHRWCVRVGECVVTAH